MEKDQYQLIFSITSLYDELATTCNVMNLVNLTDEINTDDTNMVHGSGVYTCSSEADVFIYFPEFKDNWWGDDSTHVYFRLCWQHYYLLQNQIIAYKNNSKYKMYYKEDINKLIRINKLINLL